jgi:hypothetical protein
MATEARITLAPVKVAMKVTVAQAIRISLTAIVMAKATNPMDLATATTAVDQATAMVAMEAARANPAQATAM